MNMGLNLEMGDDPKLSMRTGEGRTYVATNVQDTKKVQARKCAARVKEEIKQIIWQGNIVAYRLEDETLELLDCFNWSVNWKSAPTYTICAINEILQQLSKTRVMEQMMGKKTDSMCRLCHQYPETIEHILAGCPRLAQRQYLF